jgi:hypothetical protein
MKQDVIADFTTGRSKGELLQNGLLSKPDTEPHDDFEQRLKGFITQQQTARLTGIPPLFANVAAELTRTQYEQAHITTVLATKLRTQLELAIDNGIRTAIDRINDRASAEKAARDAATNGAVTSILKNDPPNSRDFRKLTSHEIRTWIQECTANMTQSDINKLENTGLFKQGRREAVINLATGRQKTDPATGRPLTRWVFDSPPIGEGRFRALRNTSIALWAGTIAVAGVAIAGGIALGGIGIAMGCAVSFAANAVNLVIQRGLKKYHDDLFKSTWKELRSELDTVDINRCPAFAGLMYLMVDKYSPILLGRNQTNFFTFRQPLSTEAVLQHLKDAAGAAMTNSNGQSTDSYYRGVNWKDKTNLAKNGIEGLENRWNAGWKQTEYWSSALTTMSAIGAVIFTLGA